MWKGEIHCGGEKRLYKTTYFYYIANFPVGKSAMKKHSQFYGGKTTRGGGLLSDSWYNCKTTFYLSVFCFSTIAGTVEKYSVPSAQTIKCPIHRPLSQ